MVSSLTSGIVGLEDLPQDKILVGLKKYFKQDMLSHINIIKTATSLNLKPHKIYNFKTNKKVTLGFLLKLSDYLVKQGFEQFSYDHIEKNIRIMGTKRGNLYIHNPNLPFNFNNEEGAYFIAAILFDGGIDRQFKPHYGNLDVGMRVRIVKCVENIFGEMVSKETDAPRKCFIRFPKTIGIILNSCFNIGIGNKMYCNNKIPEFIFNLDKPLKCCFLRQAFDDDGSVSINKKMIRLVGVTDVKKENFNNSCTEDFYLLNGIKNLLLGLDISPNPTRVERSFSNRQYGKQGEFYRHIYTFSITGIENLKRFHNLVGFNIDYKLKRLNYLLGSYKVFQLRKGEIHKIALEECRKFRSITISGLSKRINRPYRQTVRIVKELERKKFIKLIKPSLNIKGRRQPAVYRLV